MIDLRDIVGDGLFPKVASFSLYGATDLVP